MDEIEQVISRRTCLSAAALSYTVGPTILPLQRKAESPSIVPQQHGAQADGKHDDSSALQAALDACCGSVGALYLPPGEYRITRTLRLKRAERLSIGGAGSTSILRHDFNEPLFCWPEKVPSSNVTVSDFVVKSVGEKKSPQTPVFYFPAGLTFGSFSNLLLDGSTQQVGSGIVVRDLVDTTTFTNCVFWLVSGIGIDISHGSEVRIFGGRIVGVNTRRPGNIGLFLRGGNGGVHVSETDLIHLHTALQVGTADTPSNREIFLTHVTLDSSMYGLRQFDNAYTSIIGCWAASSDEAQITIEPSAVGALILVAGGTIFNGGAYNRGGSNHGFVAHAGAFSLSSVSVRHNKGAGILVSDRAQNYSIQGCRIHNNGTAAELGGSRFLCIDNILYANEKGVVDKGNGPKRIANNIAMDR